jgi:hypothetical protein
MHLDVAVSVRPMLGEAVSGDTAFGVERGEGVVLALADGTGHGPEARTVAERLEATVRGSASSRPGELLDLLDRALRGLVGAAAGVAHVEPARKQLVYAGVGNVVARVFGREELRLVSANGIVGQRFRVPVEQRVALEERDVFVMHSDGISERFDRHALPELDWAPAAKLAALLLSRYGKEHDDASCLVARMVP